jgi:hypothetical protein
MPRRALNAALLALEDALNAPEDLDLEDRRTLLRLQSDIERALEATEELEGASGEQVAQGAQDILGRFEADHPVLTSVLGRLADALSAMGI